MLRIPAIINYKKAAKEKEDVYVLFQDSVLKNTEFLRETGIMAVAESSF